MNSYDLESKTVSSVGGVAEKGVTADESHLESFLKDTEALHLQQLDPSTCPTAGWPLLP